MIGSRFIDRTRRFATGEAGASLVEFTVVIILFLLVFFALLDFGRLGFNWVMTEKAMQRAARIATVRPPVCGGVPETHDRGTGTDRFGSLCRVNSNCLDAGRQQCVLSNAAIDCAAPLGGGATPAQITAQEIWCVLDPILPSNATPQNIWVAYQFDENLGFLGGPYTPMVEVGIATSDNVANGANPIADAAELRFEFITPIPGLAALAGGGAPANIDAAGTGGYTLPSIPFPDLSVSLPGEDLNQGNNG